MVNEKTLRNWKNFESALDTLCAGGQYDGGFVYRGHSRRSYKLKTSFDREVTATLKKKNTAFRRVMGEFRTRAAHYITEQLSDDQWIGLAQHYGLPTRVLDWSHSPYVAAFFAVSGFSNSQKTDPPVIWVLDRRRIEAELDESEFRFIEQQPNENERARNQKGLFTEIRNDVDLLDDFLTAKGLDDALSRLVISPTCVSDARKSLSLMDISFERLFPGLEGMARQLWMDEKDHLP